MSVLQLGRTIPHFRPVRLPKRIQKRNPDVLRKRNLVNRFALDVAITVIAWQISSDNLANGPLNYAPLISPRTTRLCRDSRITHQTHPPGKPKMRIRQTISGGIFAQTNDSEIGSEVVRIEYYWVDLHAINETRVLFLLLLFFFANSTINARSYYICFCCTYVSGWWWSWWWWFKVSNIYFGFFLKIMTCEYCAFFNCVDHRKSLYGKRGLAEKHVPTSQSWAVSYLRSLDKWFGLANYHKFEFNALDEWKKEVKLYIKLKCSTPTY